MEWFYQLLMGDDALHSCFVIALVGFVGILLGKVRFGGIAFGVTFVFFVGIVAGHFGLKLNPIVSQFVQNFGLALFIFSLGLQVGPSFFPSLKAGGLLLNILSLCALLIHIGITLVVYNVTDISIGNLVGVLCGSASNSAALGAAQQALVDMGGDESVASSMAAACAATYPFGVVSSLIVVAILHKFIGEKSKGILPSESPIEIERKKNKPEIFSVLVESVDGLNIGEIRKQISAKFIVTQIMRDGEVFIPSIDTVVENKDKLLITTTAAAKAEILKNLGEETFENWVDNSTLVNRRIFVSRNEVNGKTIEALKIRKLFNVNITFVNRAGVELVATPDLVLLVGDRVNIVGDGAAIDKVEKKLGNAITKLDEPNLVVMFVGLMTGILLGSIPIFVPGMSVPVKLGLTGGSIIMGVLFGAFGYKLKLITYTTISANLFLRELGLSLYLVCLGIDSGAGFVNSIVSGNGVMLLVWGVILSLVPIVIVGAVGLKLFKIETSMVYGMICGSVTSSQTLPYVNMITGKNSGAVAYSTVYPISIFLRVVSAQVLIMILMS